MEVCPDCSATVQVQDLTNHQRLFHRQTLRCHDITLMRGDDGYFECNICGTRINEYSRMQNHLRRTHNTKINTPTANMSAQSSKSARPAPYPAPNVPLLPQLQSSSTSIRGVNSRNHTELGLESLSSRLYSASQQVRIFRFPTQAKNIMLEFNFDRQFRP